jgi:uncharacterized repeat protein (TIGR03803 family)
VGGPDEDGVIFEFTHDGANKIIYAIGEPLPSGFVRDADGNFYIATEAGGANANGTVIKVSPAGAGTQLYQFGRTGSGDAASPTGPAIGPGGTLYGFAAAGGFDDAGAVFAIDAGGSEKVLYSFTGGADGASPSSAPFLDGCGNIYGVASGGGTNNNGAVFGLTQADTLNVLYDFAGVPDGAEPAGGLLLTNSGMLYGTIIYGGSEKGAVCRSHGCGTMFALRK